MQESKSKYYFSLFVSIFLGGLFLLSLTIFWWQGKNQIDYLIASDIKTLEEIFERINETAGIVGFEHQKNYIDFLNVVSFVGSEVGPMNLKYPDKWEGPYLADNPTMQEKYYQVVKTRQGYFIVPGDGVELSNGKVIGKDIVFEPDTDIFAMMRDPEYLLYENEVLAAHLPISGAVELLNDLEDY